MGKKSNKSDNSFNTNAKLDHFLKKFDESKFKAAERHKELKTRLKTIKHDKLQKVVHKCTKREKVLESEVSRMKETVNSVEQDKLSKNLVFKGVNEFSKEADNRFFVAAVRVFLRKLLHNSCNF